MIARIMIARSAVPGALVAHAPLAVCCPGPGRARRMSQL
jgi:hypothetical protein